MKRIAIADLHFSRYKDDKEELDGLPERLSSLLKSLQFVVDYARESSITDIDIVGDIIDDKSIVYAIAQKLLLDFFITNSDLNFVVLAGNHDMSDRTERAICALEFLRPLPNVHLVAYEPHYDEDLNILYIPDSRNMVNQIKTNQARILLSHIGLSEAQLSSGISIVSDVKLANLKPYELVLLGHYHKPQELVTDHVRCYYVGSLIQLDWNDANDLKRFLVYDTETLQVESVETQGYKKFYHLKLTQDNIEEVVKEAKQLESEGNHVLLIKEDNFQITSDTKSMIGDLTIIDKSEKELTDRGVSLSMSQDEIIHKYCKIKGIEDPEQYINYLKNVIERSGIQDVVGHTKQVQVQFKNFKAQNIMAFSEEMSIEELDHPALVVIGGRNGSGKSSLFESVYWCLYGTSPRGLRGDEIVNRTTGKDCSAILDFHIVEQDGRTDHYEVRRYYKHSKFGNKVFLVKNGTDISGSSVSETKKKIESILVPEKVFSNCVFFSQQIENFFVKVPDSEKKLVLSKILDLEKYFSWRELVKEDRDRIEGELNTTEVRRSMIQESLINLENDIQEQKKLRDEFDKNKTYQLKEKENELRQLNLKLELLESELRLFPDSLESDLEKELNRLSEVKFNLKTIQEKKDLEIESLDKEFRSKALEYKSELESKKNDLASERDQKLLDIESSSKVSEIESELSEKVSEKRSLEVQINSIEALIREKQSQLENLQIQFPEEMFQVKDSISEENSRINDLELKLEQLQKAVANPSKVDCPLGLDCPVTLSGEKIKSFEEQVELIKQQLSSEMEKVNVLKSRLSELEKKAEEDFHLKKLHIEQDIDKLTNQLEELQLKLQEAEERLQSLSLDLSTERSRVERLKQEVERGFGEELQQLRTKFENFKQKLTKELNESRAAIYQNFLGQSEELESKIKQLQEDVNAIRSKIQERDKINEQIQSVQSSISTIRAEIDLISENEFDLTHLRTLENRKKEVLQTLTDIEVELNDLSRDLEIAKFWYDGLSTSGVVSLLLDSAIPFINERIKFYLELLVGNKFTVSVDTLKRLKGKDEFRDKIDVRVVNNLTKGDVTKMLSGGEVRVIDLCFMFTFRDLLQSMKKVSFSCMFLDEILDALDEEVSKRVNKLLRVLAENLRVFLITHRLFSELEADLLLTM